MNFSLYADYVKERLGRGSLYDDNGFVIFEFMQNEFLYLVDMYLKPEARNTKVGSQYLEKIKEIAKENKKTKIITTIDLKAKTKDLALLCALKGGFHISEGKNDVLFLTMEL